MITTKELMIGNYVKVNGKPYKADEIFPNAVGLEKWDTLFHESELEPIPITKELLVKNGFVEGKSKYHSGDCLIYDNSVLIYNQEDDWKVIFDKHFLWLEWYGIKYVHQLQNLMNILGVEFEFEV